MAARILFLEHNMDGTIGGSHVCLLEICRGMDRSRYQPVVWFYEHNVLEEDFRRAGAEVIVRPPPAPFKLNTEIRALHAVVGAAQSAANALRTLLMRSLAWSRTLRRLRIELVHLNNNAAADPDLIIGAILAGVPRMAHQRGFPTGFDSINRYLTRRLGCIVAISNAVTADLQAKGLARAPVHLVPDGIDPARVLSHDRREEVRAGLGIPLSAPVVGVVGNVKAWKGQLTLVQAMGRILQAHPDAHCLVVGAIADAPYQEKLRTVVREQGTEHAVHFLGYQRHPALHMSAMDVFVHTSVEPEPFGIVNLEAMALGKPVIATAHGGPLDVVLEGITGFLTPPGDHEALAATVARLFAHPDERVAMGKAGRARLDEHFTAIRNVERLQNIYDEICGRRAATNGPPR